MKLHFEPNAFPRPFRSNATKVEIVKKLIQWATATAKRELEEIKRKGDKNHFIQDGMETIICYGIACCRKQCKVCVEQN